jgi:hypothetical protein
MDKSVGSRPVPLSPRTRAYFEVIHAIARVFDCDGASARDLRLAAAQAE